MFTASKTVILEGSDKQAYEKLRIEILRHKASAARLDAIVDTAIKAGANMIKNSVSVNRLNALCLALAECKDSHLSLMARVPEYLGLSTCVAYEKNTKCFYFTNYQLAKQAVANYTLPATNFSDWRKSTKTKKEKTFLTEEKAIQQINTLYKNLQKSPYIQKSDRDFTSILNSLEGFLSSIPEYQAQAELAKLKTIVK